MRINTSTPPSGFSLFTVGSHGQHATGQTGRAFLEFAKGDSHFSRYYDGIYILFKTGLRMKVQMPKVTPHVCRHTFCSNMQRAP